MGLYDRLLSLTATDLDARLLIPLEETSTCPWKLYMDRHASNSPFSVLDSWTSR
jgi:hypothetical protein